MLFFILITRFKSKTKYFLAIANYEDLFEYQALNKFKFNLIIVYDTNQFMAQIAVVLNALLWWHPFIT